MIHVFLRKVHLLSAKWWRKVPIRFEPRFSMRRSCTVFIPAILLSIHEKKWMILMLKGSIKQIFTHKCISHYFSPISFLMAKFHCSSLVEFANIEVSTVTYLNRNFDIYGYLYILLLACKNNVMFFGAPFCVYSFLR